MNGYVSPDYLFSYWIFAWFLIYYNIDAFHNGATAFIKRHCSPLLGLWIALLFNVYEISYAMFLKFDALLFSKFAIMILLVKAIPIYLLYRKGTSIHWFNDFIALTIVFTVYNIYLYSNGVNPNHVYTETEKSLTNGDNKTPMFYLMDKLMQYFRIDDR
jgi:hypothetical protein